MSHQPHTAEEAKSQTSHRSKKTHITCSSDSYMRELLERKTKTESAKVQIEYEKKEAELKLIQAQLEEEEQKLQAEIKRRHVELQSNIDQLKAERQLDIAKVELKVYQDEIDRGSLSDILPKCDLEDSETRTKQYVSDLASKYTFNDQDVQQQSPQAEHEEPSLLNPQQHHHAHQSTQFNPTLPQLQCLQAGATLPPLHHMHSSALQQHIQPDISILPSQPHAQQNVEVSTLQNNNQQTAQPNTQPLNVQAHTRTFMQRAQPSDQRPLLTNFQPLYVQQNMQPPIVQPSAPQHVQLFQQPVPHSLLQSAPSYIQGTSGPAHAQQLAQHGVQQPVSMSDFTKFFFKKDIVKLRLSKFADSPSTYFCWKTTFKDIMKELEVTSHEELDLLQQHLGPDSSRYAINIRAANAHDPKRGLERIWERLDDKYGRPEIVQASLKSKLMEFPKVTGKEPKKLYELADLLSEIESVKENPAYGALFSYFDTSAGINPVISKLPYNIQEKWTTAAVKYKTSHGVPFPPFKYFVQFIHDLARIKNDPSFNYEISNVTNQSTNQQQDKGKSRGQGHSREAISSLKTEVEQEKKQNPTNSQKLCPIHGTRHSLNDCKSFRQRPLSDRKQYLRENRLCYRCCGTVKHIAKDCKLDQITCGICRSHKHPTGLHQDSSANSNNEQRDKENVKSQSSDGGEQVKDPNNNVNNNANNKQDGIVSRCTQICKDDYSGKSCAKIVLVHVYPDNQRDKAVKMYCIIDDQSNKTLAKTEFFNVFGENGPEVEYTISSCSGTCVVSGRKASNYTIESLDGSTMLKLPTLIECNQIPNNRNEIPTPEVASAYTHLQDIEQCIQPIDNDANILLLLGRDIIAAHQVLDQRIGHNNSPYGQRLRLGWVIIGETCLGKVHKSDQVITNKTFVLRDGQPTLHPPCVNNFHVKECNLDSVFCEPDTQLFIKSKDDNKPGKSVEDRDFEKIIKDGMVKNEHGHWEAPLPFKPNRPALPNNKPLAMKRAKLLEISLLKNETKKEHFFTFMSNILEKGFSEEVPPLPESEECWYLPIFGVYHPKKPTQIRVVFDSSAQYQGISLNNILLTGPNLTNDLLGILMRFRQGRIAATADIQQMFYGFHVQPSHRKYLRFLWYKHNDINKGLTEYHMTVHVFGNTTSPAIATYALRKTVDQSDTDVKNFVNRNFYVDDALLSSQSVQDAVDLIKKTQHELQINGKLKLHKIASNNIELMNQFPSEDLSSDIQEINFTEEYLPFHRSLGLSWNLNTDAFTFNLPIECKPFTRRGILSIINSVYDPIGFIAPVTIKGKMLLRDISDGISDWDLELPSQYFEEWTEWAKSLESLKDFKIPRTYFSTFELHALRTEVHIFSDASEKAIGSVAYLKTIFPNDTVNVGFLLGKAKLAPSKGHTLPSLELCAAILNVELYDIIQESLDISTDRVFYYTDSQVVLGYLNNTSRRFYTYVSNRIARIRSVSNPSQWNYVNTKDNPADLATRSVPIWKLQDSVWLKGPAFLQNNTVEHTNDTFFPLIDPGDDKEIRPQVVTCKTSCDESNDTILDRFMRFSKWKTLVNTICVLKHLARKTKLKQDITQNEMLSETKNFILKDTQKAFYLEEINALRSTGHVNKTSSLRKLNPFLDDERLLRVGGRIKNSYLDKNESQPIIIPGKSHVGKLLISYCHEKVFHQGRLITEGAIRTNGFWIVGCKRLVSSLIHHCVTCRKLRGKERHQLMANLPCDRLATGPPFLNVGLDVFGPWQVVARKTRGGVANNKRWAVLFTCLSTRATHIEVIEEMSSSSFINTLNRFIALTGNVRIIRSDRGTNFVGAASLLRLNCINVEDSPMKSTLLEKGISWIFNSPHSSHMGGVWERLIGVAKRILNSLLSNSTSKNLTHEVLVTFMAEVSAIMNSRPITAVSTDSDEPIVLSPALLLTHKDDSQIPLQTTFSDTEVNVRDLYRAQWRRVQYLSTYFWQRCRKEYIHTLQTRSKWMSTVPDISVGSVVLLKEKDAPRHVWPIAKVVKVLPSDDEKIRKVVVLVHRDNKNVEYTRPISELILLVDK